MNLAPKQMIQLHDHGVDPDFVRATTDSGYEFTTEDIINLHDTWRLPGVPETAQGRRLQPSHRA